MNNSFRKKQKLKTPLIALNIIKLFQWNLLFWHWDHDSHVALPLNNFFFLSRFQFQFEDKFLENATKNKPKTCSVIDIVFCWWCIWQSYLSLCTIAAWLLPWLHIFLYMDVWVVHALEAFGTLISFVEYCYIFFCDMIDFLVLVSSHLFLIVGVIWFIRFKIRWSTFSSRSSLSIR